MHQEFPSETLTRFLKARDWNVAKAHKMLIDCLQWRTQNEIDSILAKPIFPTELYRSIRDTQLVGLSGHSKQGLPVVACGVGQSTYDKASVHYYVQSHIQMNEYRDRVVLPNATKKYGRHIGTCIKILDMTGLRLSALNQIKVVKPLLQERTRKKIQVLQGSGKDELLKIMDYSSLPHFSRKEGSGSSRVAASGTTTNCFSLDHPMHQQLYNYVKQQADLEESASPLRQGSVHVDYPEPDPTDAKIMKTIESELHKLSDMKGLNKSFSRVRVSGA
ncbi:Phosphatidylinositol/phosphatidylcholine transfer protein SFH1 [Linum perenne]